MMSLLCWHLKHDLKTTKSRKEFLALRFGKPLYHACYEYREAVWGFYFEGSPVIVYYSEKGLSVQVDPKTTVKSLTVLVQYLKKILA